MSAEYQKKMRELVTRLEDQGWTMLPPGRRCHHKIKAPSGGVVVMPNSPSDHRAWKNLLSVLRRYGAVLPR